jgi:hypothetical protein
VTEEEFCGLPPSIAFSLVYKAFAKELASVPVPKVPLAPKFDSRISRKGGMFVWASEMLLNDLIFWHDRNAAGATDGSQYAEKNAKLAKSLSYWVNYRRAFPTEVWFGERGPSIKVRANPPSRDPEQYPWESSGKGGGAPRESTGRGFADADADAGGGDDDIPF